MRISAEFDSETVPFPMVSNDTALIEISERPAAIHDATMILAVAVGRSD